MLFRSGIGGVEVVVWMVVLALGCGAEKGEDVDDTDPVVEDSDTPAVVDDDDDEGDCRVGPFTERCDCVAYALPVGETACRAVRVVVWDDDVDGVVLGSGPAIVAHLEAGPFEVTRFGALWDDWGGVDIAGVDVIFWAEAVNYHVELAAEGLAAVEAHLQAGGALVRSEWGCGWQGRSPELCPVVSPEGNWGTGDVTWEATGAAGMGAFVAGLGGGLGLGHGYAWVEPVDADAVVVAEIVLEGGERLPGITVDPGAEGAGPVVHLNHDLGYQPEQLEGDAVGRLLRDVVFGAAVAAGR